jgi:hypothetical protein
LKNLDKDEGLLLGQFLLKLELLRLSEVAKDGSAQSRAEVVLIKENEILRSRLATLKENISVLNSMIEQVRNAPTGSANKVFSCTKARKTAM